jgi:hypothetical protein
MCRLKNYFLISAQKWSNNYKKKEIIEKVKVNLLVYFLFFLTKHHDMKTSWGSGGKNLHILDLGTRWRWVVSFTPRPLYPQGKSPWHPLDRRLGGPQNRSEHGGEDHNSEPLPGLELPIIEQEAECYTTELSRFQRNYSVGGNVCRSQLQKWALHKFMGLSK